jgi:hypothetical protein
MKHLRLMFAAAVAASFLTATAAGACDGKNGKSGCGKTKTMASCHGEKTGTTAHKGCCAGARMTASNESCTLPAGAVAIKGTILCNHCDLKKTESCQSVLHDSKGCNYILADNDQVAQLRDKAGHGSHHVKIWGEADDKGTVTVTRFKIRGGASSASMGM